MNYDGDDWGDDEYGEYDNDDVEDDEGQTPVSPVSRTAAAAGKSATPSPVERPRLDRALRSDSPASSARSRSGGDSSVPFVRPAEIYKRMREERQRQAAASSRANSESPRRSAVEPEQQRRSEMRPAVEHPQQQKQPQPQPQHNNDHQQEQPREEAVPSSGQHLSTTQVLPEIKRVSAFDTSFLGEDDATAHKGEQQREGEEKDAAQEHHLQHNPSLGFRSVVNQAFDQDMPASSGDSIARTNSDSASDLSPIMNTKRRGGGLQDESKKAQAIMEEPAENASQDDHQHLAFKPGHRRDWSLPSSEKSASRKPEVHESDEGSPQSDFADLSTASPDRPSQYETVSTPAPLRLTHASPSVSPPGPEQQHYYQAAAGGVPKIVSSVGSEKNSPLDGDNDQLREEIMMSLSRENSPAGREEPEESTTTAATKPGDITTSTEEVAANQTFPGISLGQRPPELPPRAPEAVDSGFQRQQQQPPLLKRRFSWESSSSEESTGIVYGGGGFDSQQQQPQAVAQNRELDGSNGTQAASPAAEGDGAGGLFVHTGSSTEDLRQVEPEAVDDEPSSSPHPSHPEETETAGPVVLLPPQQQQQQRNQRHAQHQQPILGFRDILHIKYAPERIRAFERTRNQFADIDTGLNEWIGATMLTHPEYSDIVESNEQFAAANQKLIHSKGAKFPRLPSLGNFASHLDVAGSVPKRNNSSSLGSQRGSQRGKEILHTAGVLGGKAGDAAKGLFHKGRNKLRNTEKAE